PPATEPGVVDPVGPVDPVVPGHQECEVLAEEDASGTTHTVQTCPGDPQPGDPQPRVSPELTITPEPGQAPTPEGAPAPGGRRGRAGGSHRRTMFEALSDRFDGIFKRLRGKGKLSEADVDEVLREIRVALLEADVNFTVVKAMQRRIRERAVGAELHEALNPAQQVIKIVHEELIAALGGETMKITYASRPPTVVLMAGLQGSGKTTNSAKLARWFKQQGRNPLMFGADLQRPAAVEQLRTLAKQIDVPVFSQPGDPVATAAAGLEEARRLGRDVLIVDTAGRLAIDEELMEQVRQISEAVTP